jgi:hypothetical protein
MKDADLNLKPTGVELNNGDMYIINHNKRANIGARDIDAKIQDLEDALNAPSKTATQSTRTGTLTFALPEDEHDCKVASNAHIYRQAVVNAMMFIRNQSKHNEQLTDSELILLNRVGGILLDEIFNIGDDI